MKTRRGKRHITLRTRKALMGYLFIMPFVIGAVFFILSPMITSIRMSFSEVSIDFNNSRYLFKNVGLENYRHTLLVDPDFNRLLVEELRSVLIDTPTIVTFSIIIAVILNRKIPGRAIFRSIFFIPVIITAGVILKMDKNNYLVQMVKQTQDAAVNVSLTTSLRDILIGVFGSDTKISTFVMNVINHLYDIVVSSSIQIVIFLSALQTIPAAIYESARLEGCSQWELFWKITLPMISPMILVSWIYTVVDSFIKSDNLLMEKVISAVSFSMDFGFSAAMAWIVCISMLAFIGVSALIIRKMVYYYE